MSLTEYTGVRNRVEFVCKKNCEWTLGLLRRCVPVLLGIFIFFLPFPHTTTIKEVAYFASLLIVAVLLSCGGTRVSFKTPMTFPFLIFTAWALAGLPFALDLELSIKDLLAHWLKYLGLYFLLFNYFGSKRGLTHLSWIFVVSSSLFCMGGLLWEYVVLDNSPFAQFGMSFVQTPTNLIGIVTIFAVLLGINMLRETSRLKLRILLVICLVFPLSVTLFTQSRSTFLALVVALSILLIRHKRALIIFLLIFAGVTALLPIRHRLAPSSASDPRVFSSIDHRISLTYICLEIMRDYPVFGTGFGITTFQNRQAIDPDLYNSRIPPQHGITEDLFNWPHNMLLSVGVRMGVVGIGLLVYLIATAWMTCWKLVRSGADAAIRRWSLCILSAFSMFIIKGFFEPVFTHYSEPVLFTIFSITSILWSLDLAGRPVKGDGCVSGPCIPGER